MITMDETDWLDFIQLDASSHDDSLLAAQAENSALRTRAAWHRAVDAAFAVCLPAIWLGRGAGARPGRAPAGGTETNPTLRSLGSLSVFENLKHLSCDAADPGDFL